MVCQSTAYLVIMYTYQLFFQCLWTCYGGPKFCVVYSAWDLKFKNLDHSVVCHNLIWLTHLVRLCALYALKWRRRKKMHKTFLKKADRPTWIVQHRITVMLFWPNTSIGVSQSADSSGQFCSLFNFIKSLHIIYKINFMSIVMCFTFNEFKGSMCIGIICYVLFQSNLSIYPVYLHDSDWLLFIKCLIL